MPVGTGAGIGIGIGEGLGEIGDAIRARRERQDVLREQRATDLHQQADNYYTHTLYPALKASGYSLNGATRQLIDDKTKQPAQNVDPQMQGMLNEYLGYFDRYKGLFPDDQPNAMMQHFRKMMKMRPGVAKPNPRATEITPGGVAGEAQVPENTFLRDTSNEIAGLMQMGGISREEATKRVLAKRGLGQAPAETADFEKLGEPRLDKTTGSYYQPYASKSDPSKQKTVRMPMDFQPTGTSKKGTWEKLEGTVDGSPVTFWHNKGDNTIQDLAGNDVSPEVLSKFKSGATVSPEQLTAMANAYSNFGVKPSAKYLPLVQEYMARNNMVPQPLHIGGVDEFIRREYGTNPTAAQLQKAHEIWSNQGATTTGTHQIEVLQPDGTMHMYQVTTTSQKTPGSGGGGSAATPTAPVDLGPVGGHTAAATLAKRDQAQVVLRSGQQLIEKINAARTALGPLRGRIGSLEVGIGSADPVIRGLYTSLKSFAALQPALHGSRGVGMQKEFEAASARLSDNPDAAIAAINALMDQAKNFASDSGDQGKAGGKTITVSPEDMK
jgi:hypothetical protein